MIENSVVAVSNMQKPEWCLAVKTTYVKPARRARRAHSRGSNRVGLKLRGSSVRYHLHDLLGDQDKVARLLRVMVKIECAEGDFLFRQGDPDSGFFVLESGYMSATIDTGRGFSQRVKKFSPGSVIGELSSYTVDGTRTASVFADTPAVLYYLNPESLGNDAIVHELVARTLGVRMEYMNRRLMWELI